MPAGTANPGVNGYCEAILVAVLLLMSQAVCRRERIAPERATAVWGGGHSSRHDRLLVLYPPPSDPDHFRSYYEDTHLPLVAKQPGLRAYRDSFDVAAGEAKSPYYCVFEADFDDAAALSAARESPEGQAVRADVPNYATGGAVVLNYELRAD